MADNTGKSARRPRAVMVSRLFRPEPAAASLALGAIADGLVREGFEVTVLTSRPPQEFEVRDDPGLTVRRAPVLRDKAGYVRGYVQYMSFDVPLFFRLLLERRPDVVICEPPPTTGAVVRVVCALRRVPYAYRAADLWSDAVKETTAPPVVSAVLTRLENWVLNGASTLMTVHEGMEERLAGRGISARTRRLGFGIDTDVFTPEGRRVDTTGPLFVYAGTASEVHGAEIFVEAFRALLQRDPTARLVFIGQGESFAEIRRQAASLPEGAVQVLGRMSPEQTAEWIRSSVATLASVKPGPYGFAFPTKAFASAACGTPVIYAGAEDAGRQVVQEGLGVAVPYDADAVARAMADLALDERSAGARAASAASKARSAPVTSAVRSSAQLRAWALEHVSARRLGQVAAAIINEIVAEGRARRR
nr:glycosyltransferase family 4 protein [Actinomyces oris]